MVEKLCALEGAEAGLLTSSGMAALSTLFMALLKPGGHVIMSQHVYGGTLDWAQNEFPRWNVECEFVAPDVNAIENALREDTSLIHVESPGNPFSNVIDLRVVAKLAKSAGAYTSIDGTYASPILQNPLALGIDVVMHSATKYLGGHSDLCAGVLLASKPLMEKMYPIAVRFGGSVNAQTAWLLERSVKTLNVRVQRHSENGLIVARRLQNMSGISKVYYPGLTDHPDHEIARQQMRGFGGMLAFELADDIDPTRFQKALNMIHPAISFGGVESTLCQPELTSHMKISVAERRRQGITPQLIRLSVGIENPEDILADLKQALGC